MNIYLIGFMASGKTTVGKKLAKMLKLDFYDLDVMIEKKHNKSISRIFTEEYEDVFRKKEHQLLLEMSAKDNFVLATGGGTPCFYKNIELMNNAGNTVYLRMQTSALFSRLLKSKSKRPLINDFNENELKMFIDNTLKEREPFYAKAKFTIDALDIDIKSLAEILKQF